jgi:hypothetical protein
MGYRASKPAVPPTTIIVPSLPTIHASTRDAYKSIHTDVNTIVMMYVFPIEITHEKMQAAVHEMSLLSIISQSDISVYKRMTSEIQELWALTIKYPDHQLYQQKYALSRDTGDGAFCLLAVLHNSYENRSITGQHLDDIKKMVTLLPMSIKCEIGMARCRDRMTALEIACLHPNVPLSIVEFLLNNGSDLQHIYSCNNSATHILLDMERAGVDPRRNIYITKMFSNNGVNKDMIVGFLYHIRSCKSQTKCDVYCSKNCKGIGS